MAKATRVGAREAIRTQKFEEMIIRKEHLQPGVMVSLDQYQTSTPGRLPNTAGKEHMNNRFHGGTLMLDHATGYRRNA